MTCTFLHREETSVNFEISKHWHFTSWDILNKVTGISVGSKVLSLVAKNSYSPEVKPLHTVS